MSRKFARVPGCRIALVLMGMAILAGAATVYAQDTPAQAPPSNPPSAQQPAAQQPADQPQTANPQVANPQSSNPQSSTQEVSAEELPGRKPKEKGYNNWSFNVGGGGSLTNGETTKFVRGGGGVGAAGVARNVSKYFGLRFDFQYDNLPLRTSALDEAQALSGTSQVYSFLLNPIINIPVTRLWSGYIVAGGGFFPSLGKAEFFDRDSRIGLQRVFHLVGQLLQRQPSAEREFCFHRAKPVGRKFWRRDCAQGSREYRDLWRVPLPAWDPQRHYHGFAADYGWRALGKVVIRKSFLG